MQVGRCCRCTSNNIPFSIRRWLMGYAALPQEVTNPASVGYSDTAWTFGPRSQPDNSGAFGPPDPTWSCSLHHSNYTTSTVVDGETFVGYVRHMHPMRFRMQGPATVGWNLHHYLAMRRMCRPLGHDFGYRSSLPPTGAHIAPMGLSAVEFNIPLTRMDWQKTNPWSTNQYGLYAKATRITAYRVVVDGTDRTGIVAVSRDMPWRSPHPYQATYSPQFPVNAALNSVVSGTSQTVFVDVWAKLDLFGHYTYFFTDLRPLYVSGKAMPVASNDAYSQEGVLKFANAAAVAKDSHKWTFTFDVNGPGGVSSITTETTAGWTLASTSSSRKMTHDATGDYVEIDWFSEHPVVTVRLASQYHNPSTSPQTWDAMARYWPADSGHYDTILDRDMSTPGPRFALYGEYPRGIWSAGGTTTFKAFARLTKNTSQWGTDYVPKQYGSVPYSNFPQSITVAKV